MQRRETGGYKARNKTMGEEATARDETGNCKGGFVKTFEAISAERLGAQKRTRVLAGRRKKRSSQRAIYSSTDVVSFA